MYGLDTMYNSTTAALRGAATRRSRRAHAAQAARVCEWESPSSGKARAHQWSAILVPGRLACITRTTL